ncbi:SP0191 family lipoprotein [Streptococcus himalayensis]|uniref:SP-0191-like C-terminal domain-containing protein n=1 Tax=Streptococcus himalayensis TaxID=1888195 RepID=A0A917EFT8_9STRE|nr:SP0191 family lipoprotein [Streptococcus himalayensis]GGE36047.1 hypothetical protein GCM10011510_16740 [Streptococcus himalayensis]
MKRLGMLLVFSFLMLGACSSKLEQVKPSVQAEEVTRVFKGTVKGLEEEAKVTSRGSKVLTLDLIVERPLSEQEKEYITRLDATEVLALIEAGLDLQGEFERLQALEGFDLTSELTDQQVFRLTLHFDMETLNLKEARQSELLKKFDLDQLMNVTADDLIESLKDEGLVEVH